MSHGFVHVLVVAWIFSTPARPPVLETLDSSEVTGSSPSWPFSSTVGYDTFVASPSRPSSPDCPMVLDFDRYSLQSCKMELVNLSRTHTHL